MAVDCAACCSVCHYAVRRSAFQIQVCLVVRVPDGSVSRNPDDLAFRNLADEVVAQIQADYLVGRSRVCSVRAYFRTAAGAVAAQIPACYETIRTVAHHTPDYEDDLVAALDMVCSFRTADLLASRLKKEQEIRPKIVQKINQRNYKKLTCLGVLLFG